MLGVLVGFPTARDVLAISLLKEMCMLLIHCVMAVDGAESGGNPESDFSAIAKTPYQIQVIARASIPS
jgi:hypothetical protein